MMSGSKRARQSVASEAAAGEGTEDSAVATGLGVTKDLTKAAAVGASVGFSLAHRCQVPAAWWLLFFDWCILTQLS